MQRCCESLFEILKLNKDVGGFDPDGDRRFLFRKLRSGVDYYKFGGICETAERHGHLDCLRLAHEIDIPWDASTPSAAANSVHLECLMYIHENMCIWDERTCNKAAAAGHLHCLR